MRTCRSRWLGLAGVLAAAVGGVRADAAPASQVPEHNRPDQPQPSPRPDPGSAQRRAKQLFDAIVHDDPALAKGVFFPRAAFLLVKDIQDPGAYFDQLHARFVSDIHVLHRRSPGIEHAQFERFELARRGGLVGVKEEGNRLPYWAARHSWLHYVSAGKRLQLEVRVMISWGTDWFVIHLNEFK